MTQDRIILTQGERASSTWGKTMEYLNGRLAALRRQLEGDLDDRQTIKLRGQIAEVKFLMSLNEERPVIEES